MSSDLPESFSSYLEQHRVMTLATCGPDGPWAAAVFYVSVGSTLYFLAWGAVLHHQRAVLARQRYADKFPLVGRLASAPAVIVAALAKVHWYGLQPRHMHFIDNSRGFGHRELVDLGRGP